jgi:hypothetical protein
MPRRTTGDNSGAELRAWLLAEERELYEAMTRPPPEPMNERTPWRPPEPVAAVGPPLEDVLAAALGGWIRTLAEGKAYRLCRRDLPLDHPARRVGDLGDALVLTEDNELVPE